MSHLAQDPVKRRLRADWYWPTVRALAGEGPVLTLPSRCTTDLHTVTRLFKSVTCVDYEASVMSRVGRQFPTCQCLTGDVFDVIPRLTQPYAVLDLDLCCAMSERVAVGLVDVRVSRAVRPGTIIGLTLCSRSPEGLRRADRLRFVRDGLAGCRLVAEVKYRNSIKHSPMWTVVLEAL